jgi:pimeloyl-ACP methyl ester carboxylesterase
VIDGELPVHPNAPGWFRRALSVPFTDEVVRVDGADVHYLAWGEPGRPGIVFVHGGAAHAHWWTHVAATFAEEYRVLAIDLTGHGDSDHRPTYDIEQWTREVMAVVGDGAIDGRPVVVGHSMGGMVAVVTAGLNQDVGGVVVCDSPVTEPDPEIGAYRLKEAFGRPRVYPTVEEALERFRTVPLQDQYLDYVMDHVGRRSLRPAEGGWCWKFDRQIFAQFGVGSLRAMALPYLADVTCPFDLLRSEHGLVTRDIGQFMYDKLGRVTPVIEIPEAGHHAMLDQPLLLLVALRTLLAHWAHSDPHRRAGA